MRRVQVYMDVMTCDEGPLRVGEWVELIRADGPREGDTIATAQVIVDEDGNQALNVPGYGRWPLVAPNDEGDER